MAGHTKQERSLIILMGILAVTFLLIGILFAIAPDYTLGYITDIGRWLLGWRSPSIKLGQERFWLVPSVSLAFAMSYVCAVVHRDPVQNIEYVRFILITTFVSTVGFTICLFTSGAQFFYLIAAILVGIVFVVTLIIYRLASLSRNRWL